MGTLLWGPRRLAPTAPHIRVHNPKARPEAPDEVAFLGDAEELLAHYLRGRSNIAGRSVPCEGAGCPHCSSGEVVLRNYYAPALLHYPGNLVGGRQVWERVAFYIPQGAVQGFGPGITRGRMFKVWRMMVGSVQQIRSRYVGPVQLAEPVFDVRPVLEHFFQPNPVTKAAVEAVYHSCPPLITPPVLQTPKEPVSKPTEAELELIRKAAGRAGDTPLSAKVDPEKLREVEDVIRYKGQTIAERKANGTYAPKSEGGEK